MRFAEKLCSCRRHLQFSLRTLLIATTLAALGCWWFLQPQSRDELLARNYLKLRRQVREKPQAQLDTDSYAELLANVGVWRVRDQQDRLLVEGRYADGEPHGTWVLYYPSGHKAAEGEMQRGCRAGLWRTWDERGTLRSEVMYRVVKLPRSRPAWHRVNPTHPLHPHLTTIPVVGMTSPLLQLGTVTFDLPEDFERVYYQTERHGSALGWHPDGQPQFAGHYVADRRAGRWTYYDAAGKVTAEGEYERDCREGTWTFYDAAKGRNYKTKYIAGRTSQEYEQWLNTLRQDLAGDDFARHITAIEHLADLGPRGGPIIADLLTDPRDELKILALRALLERGTLTENMLPVIEHLSRHPDERLSLRARLAVYRLSPPRREALFEPTLHALLSAGDEHLAHNVLQSLYVMDPPRRRSIARALIRDHVARMNQPEPRPRLRDDFFEDHDYVDRTRAIAALAQIDEKPLWAALCDSFATSDVAMRVFVLRIARHAVELGPAHRVVMPNGTWCLTFSIPAELQPLLEQAKADPDELVRSTAKLVGTKGGPIDCAF